MSTFGPDSPLEQGLYDYIRQSIAETPFYRFMGIEMARAGKGYMVFEINAEEKHANSLGLVQGGLLLSLADGAMGNAVRTLGIVGVTVDISASFIKPAPFGQLISAEGIVIKANKSLVYAQSRVLAGDQLLASAKGTFYVKGPLDIAK